MVIIALLFCFISIIEIWYLRQMKRKRRTFFCAIGTLFFAFLYFEALYLLRDRFQMGFLLESIFGPIDHVIMWRGGIHE